VNAKDHRIQVLNSYGTLFGIEDLEDTVSFNYFGYLYLFLPIAHITMFHNYFGYRSLEFLWDIVWSRRPQKIPRRYRGIVEADWVCISMCWPKKTQLTRCTCQHRGETGGHKNKNITWWVSVRFYAHLNMRYNIISPLCILIAFMYNDSIVSPAGYSWLHSWCIRLGTICARMWIRY
jgi:hypothetical protein